MTVLIVGLILFLGGHSIRIVAPAWRDAQLARMGENGWKGLYSLVSLAGLVLLIWGYALARPDAPVLYEPPVWMKHVNATIMLLAFLALGIYQVPAGRLKPALKHPMLLATKLWAVGHLLANGDLASIILFGTFLLWAVADRIAVKRRGQPVPAPGPVSFDLLGLAVGLGLYLLFLFWAHAWLFGVAPL